MSIHILGKTEVSFEQQREMCWRQALNCKNCHYEGGMHNLYGGPINLMGSEGTSTNRGWLTGPGGCGHLVMGPSHYIK